MLFRFFIQQYRQAENGIKSRQIKSPTNVTI
jgi:hypothetical protein